MPAPAHRRYVVKGVFGPVASPVEEWSWSFATPTTLDPNAFDYQNEAIRVEAAYRAHLANINLATTVITSVKVSAVDGTGHVPRNEDGAFLQHEALTPAGMGAGQSASAVRYPLQTALCVTLDTARSGPRGRGRFFMPWPGFAIGTDFRMAGPDVATVATAVNNFFGAVLGGPPAPGNLVVPSQYGHLSEVTHIEIGSVPDTMRSRRGRLVEVRTRQPIAT